MAKSKANLADYAIMVEPLSDADGGGWLAESVGRSG
jgi:antitoxin HicB